MALLSGSRLGAYEIIAATGAGGMGEVCRARDPRLGRDVASKILPDHFAGDPDRLALNHLNLGSIYGVEDRALEATRGYRRDEFFRGTAARCAGEKVE